ncbi:MAG: Fic family protein [Gammaproteobacteria bacterium]|nr:Fic family protein [Gammaproteobacteria bacterium]
MLESIVALVGRANACLSRYDGLLESLVNPGVLLSPLLMKEAELSSRIEGTIATANEVYQQQAGEEFEPEKKADIQEILNYRNTLRAAEQTLKEQPVSLHLIRQMHEILMEGVRGKNKNPGRFRDTQNWIGPRGCSIEDATYVPPPPIALNDLLENYITFINDRDDALDPIIQAALVHAQFELIHPFDDGNGRIGRLLIPLFLMKRGCLVSPSLYISGYLEANRDSYYDSLGRISSEGDWLGWIRYFLNALVDQAESNLQLVRRIIELYDRKKTQISELLHSDKGIYILDMLFDSPVFRANMVHERLKIQRQRAAQYIRTLRDAGVITELQPASGRRPALLSFEDLWKITDQQ